MTLRPRRTNYSSGEVESLVTDYEELRAKRSTTRAGLRYIVALADLDRAVSRLSRVHREAIILHGRVGFSYAECARRLGVSGTTIGRRYAKALDRLLVLINGGK